MKILLVRNNELSDISQNLESRESTNHPLKVFGSIAAGKLAQNDKVIVLNKEIFSVLTKDKGFLKQLKQVANAKELKEIIKKKKQILNEVSGACLFLLVNDDPKTKQLLTFRQEAPPFSFKKTFIRPIAKLIPSFKLPSLKLPEFKMPKFKLPEINLPSLKFKNLKLSLKLSRIKMAVPKKNFILILALILVLIAFFIFFQGEREIEMQEAQQKIEQAQSKLTMAENMLILNEEEKAQALFQEAWDIIQPLTKIGEPLRDEALDIKKLLEEYLE